MCVMDVRHNPLIGVISQGLRRLNARHPWSHNDHFHPWLLRRLPASRRLAVDVGCGQGLLVSRLAGEVDQVVGTDPDPRMRELAASQNRGQAGVTITELPLPAVIAEHGHADVVTMVAVLHHLEAETALRQVRDALAPGGRFLAVGLAPPVSLRDTFWDLASAVSSPVIGFVKHPRPAHDRSPTDPFPVTDPSQSFDEIRTVLDAVMPGARLRHRLGFRHTIEWTRPAGS